MKIKHVFINWSTKFFEGFYESNLFHSDSEYNLSENLGSPHEIKDFHNFMRIVAGRIANNVYYPAFCEENGIVTDLDFVEVDSPMYYNYRTDRIVLNVEFDLEKLEDFCFNDSSFNTYLQDNFTSYDGFHSFVPNNRVDFYSKYKGEETDRQMCLDVMLEYYFLSKLTENDVYDMREIANEVLYEYAEPVEDE